MWSYEFLKIRSFNISGFDSYKKNNCETAVAISISNHILQFFSKKIFVDFCNSVPLCTAACRLCAFVPVYPPLNSVCMQPALPELALLVMMANLHTWAAIVTPSLWFMTMALFMWSLIEKSIEIDIECLFEGHIGRTQLLLPLTLNVAFRSFEQRFEEPFPNEQLLRKKKVAATEQTIFHWEMAVQFIVQKIWMPHSMSGAKVTGYVH